MLRVARRLGAELPVSVRSTCLAAHALPPEYTDRADDYIDHICADMLRPWPPKGWWMRWMRSASTWRSRQRRSSGYSSPRRELGLPVKLHAEQLSSLHGSSLAARYHALSADHLEFMTEDDAIAMAEVRHRRGVAARCVLLPA